MDVDLFFIIFPDIGQCFLDHFDPLVMVFLHGGEETVAGKHREDAEQRGLYIQLAGQVVGDGAVAEGQVFDERAEGLHDLCKCGVNRSECRMAGKEKPGEAYFPVLHGLEQLHLRGIIGIEA